MTDFASMPLGKKPATIDARTLKAERYIKLDALPPVPTVIDYTRKVPRWPMFLNDQLGCCLVGDTQVSMSHLTAAQRIPYNGPIITLQLASGRRLSITPHHAILTPAGFVPACLLKQGDDAISSDFAEQVVRTLDPDSDHAPATVEQVFEALFSRTDLPRRKAVALPIDFDSDDEFINGDVDVVWAAGFLEGEPDAALCEPDCEEQIGTPRKLQGSFHRAGTSLLGRVAGRPTTLSIVSGVSESTSFFGTQAAVHPLERLSVGANRHTSSNQGSNQSLAMGVVALDDVNHRGAGLILTDRITKIRNREALAEGKPDRFRLRARLQASRRKPTTESLPTDPELASNIRQAFPGLVTAERIDRIDHGWLDGHVYDLSTGPRWLFANGIVTHNCVISAMAHQEEADSAENGAEVPIIDADILAGYEACGDYVPGHPETDQGTDPLRALKWWRSTGIAGNKIGAFVSVNPADESMVAAALYLFGGLFVGLELPKTAQTQTIWDVVGDGKTGDSAPASWGGHMIYVPAREAQGQYANITWGERLGITQRFLATYSPGETYAVIPDAWLSGSGQAPNGLDIAALRRDLAIVGGQDPGPEPAPPPWQPDPVAVAWLNWRRDAGAYVMGQYLNGPDGLAPATSEEGVIAQYEPSILALLRGEPHALPATVPEVRR